MAVDFQAEVSPAPKDVARADGPKKPVPATPRRFDWRAMAMMVGGGLATGALVAGFAAKDASGAPGFELQIVAQDDIAAASQSLVAAVAGSLVDEARACRTPLAYLLVRSDGTSGGSIRFRSGAYQSPNIRLGPAAVRTAVPFPAPYATGHGQILVDTTTAGADVFLVPGAHVEATSTSKILNVHWIPKKPC